MHFPVQCLDRRRTVKWENVIVSQGGFRENDLDTQLWHVQLKQGCENSETSHRSDSRNRGNALLWRTIQSGELVKNKLKSDLTAVFITFTNRK